MPASVNTVTPRKPVTRQLWFWVLVAIAAGIVLGLVAPGMARETKWLADAFIQLIKAITGPVIFVTVVVGIASLGNLARAGGLALRALTYFLVATVVALALGLLAGNLVQPGAGFTGAPSDEALGSAQEQIESGSQESGLVPFLLEEVVPASVVAPFVENKILQVLVLAILTACAISALTPRLRERIVGGIEAAAKVLFGLIRLIMWVAPLAAFGGIVAIFGATSLTNLATLMATFWATCVVFVVVVLGSVAAYSGFNILKLIRLIKDELLIILVQPDQAATGSSSSTW